MSDETTAPTHLRRWLSELRERRVLHVLAVYLVGTWLALQIADVAVLPALGVPEAGMRYLVIAASLGLPIAFALAWRYEITSDGIVPHAWRSKAAHRSAVLGTSDRWFIGALSAAILLVAGATVFKLAQMSASQPMQPVTANNSDEVPRSAVPGSLAVLPFANLSEDPQMEYLGEGLAEELLNRLATVPSLNVTARTSAFSFRGRNVTVQEIGDALGVAHVLEGSVRRSNDALRITVQLVDTANGYRIWSSTYDRKLADVFAIQDEIAETVLDSLRVMLTPLQRSVVTAHGTSDPEALDLYLRARYLYQRLDPTGMDAAIRHLHDVIERDPSFAAAYVALADAMGLLGQMRSEKENIERRRLLEKAIELDPTNADAHAVLGNDLALRLELDAARRELAQAEQLNPNGELVLRYRGQNYAVWDWPPEKAIDYMLRGQKLDPLNPWAITNLAIAYFNADRFEQARQTADRALELDPGFWVAWWTLDLTYYELGRYQEAVDAARRALELSSGYVDLYGDLVVMLAAAGNRGEAEAVYAKMEDPRQQPRWRGAYRAFALGGLGRYDDALLAIEKCVREHDGFVIEMLDHPVFVPLHDNPRFIRVVKELQQERRVERVRQRLGLGALDPKRA